MATHFPCYLSLYCTTKITLSSFCRWSTAEIWNELVEAVEEDGDGEVADELEDGRHDVLDHEAEEARLGEPVRDGVLPRVALVGPQVHAVELDPVCNRRSWENELRNQEKVRT